MSIIIRQILLLENLLSRFSLLKSHQSVIEVSTVFYEVNSSRVFENIELYNACVHKEMRVISGRSEAKGC
ncbi:hypothetical protein NC652_031324 [Populus alba x Populus x berolinensis]|nr:hypothetical protein NC652_031324 [Populus alba x Populus x berolinensis]